MKVDLFVTNQPLPYTAGYGLIESIDFIPILHAYWYGVDTGKVYQIVDILQTRDRTIAICIERNFAVHDILNVPGASDGPDVCYPSCSPVT